jgi:hypothetical protein
VRAHAIWLFSIGDPEYAHFVTFTVLDLAAFAVQKMHFEKPIRRIRHPKTGIPIQINKEVK